MLRLEFGSLGLFHMPLLQRALARDHLPRLNSTWKPGTPGPNPDLLQRNLPSMHYGLQVYTRYPWLRFNNHAYSALVAACDASLTSLLDPKETDVYIPLSGVALWSGRKFRRAGKLVILECGSTHTDFQHEVMEREFKNNNIRGSLFPSSYRNRVRQEFLEADIIQIPSSFVATTFLERGIPQEKLAINPYGTDTSHFKPRDSDDLERPLRILCASLVNIRKGARFLAHAWRKLGWRDAELHWVGTIGPECRHLFSDNMPPIHWHPWLNRKEMAQLYAQCDVLVLPSLEEGFARVIIEGAASGLAIIATAETGVEEFFSPGHPEGWLIPSGSVDALCDCFIQAKADRALTRQRGKYAVTRSQTNFDVASYAKRALDNLQRFDK